MGYWNRNLNIALTVALGIIVFFSSAANARQLNFALGFPPGAIPIVAAEKYGEVVKESAEGDLTVKVYPMSLLNMAETSPGLRDGMADIGLVLTQYTPAEYPHNNLIAESTMMLRLLGEKAVGKEATAYAGALTEFVFNKCPECLEEYKQQNQVFTGGGTGTSYGLVCNKPVKSLSDLRGKRLRVGASQWARWSQHVGATSVTLTGNEMYEALSQGVVDCIVVSAPEIHNFGLLDVTTDLTMAVPGGIFVTALANVNTNTWSSLNSDQRKALLRASAYMSAYGSLRYHNLEDEVFAAAKDKGVRFHDADSELVEDAMRFIEQDMQTMVDYYTKQHKLERASEMLAEFRPILEKWTDLVDGIQDTQELADLFWDEVYSKVDVSKHGL